MEKSRRNLKNMSIVVLALAALSLINIIFEVFFGALNSELNNATLPDGSPDNIVLIAQIFILVISVLALIPQVYIGIKGIKVAKNPDKSRAHIIWGVILIALTAFSLLTPLVAFFQGQEDAFENVASFCSILVDVVVLFEYVCFAKAVRAEA